MNLKLIDWILDKLTNHWEKKCQKQMGGIPMLWVIYQPDKPAPNMVFRPHPMFNGDTAFDEKCKELAEYMRDKYLEVKEG